MAFDDDDDPDYPTIRRGGRPVTSSPAEVAAGLISAVDADESGTPSMLTLVKPSRTMVAPPLKHLPDAPVTMPVLRAVQQSALLLSADEQHILAQAIDNERPIEITYSDSEDRVTRRVIEPLDLNGAMLSAYCRLRHDEREFYLPRIGSVRPI